MTRRLVSWRSGALGSVFAMAGALLVVLGEDTSEYAPQLFGVALALVGWILIESAYGLKRPES